MRIISGEFGGRRITPPEGRQHTRPTSDRMRESIFNKLAHMLEGGFAGKRVADVFAGTGAMGLEALSRGANFACFVEKHAGMELVRQNAASLNVTEKCRFLGADARNLPPVDAPFSVTFMDPPYGRGLAEPALLSAAENDWFANDSIAVVEMSEDDEFNPPACFAIVDDRSKGITRVVYLNFTG